MKQRIIDQAILLTKKEGLKFSIDLLCANLKISKKTIYKYFVSKEDLAVEMYKKQYDLIEEKLKNLDRSDERLYFELLNIYYESYNIIKKKMFNKFMLNEKVKDYAYKRHARVWFLFNNYLVEKNDEFLKLIIDSTFENVDEIDKNKIIERLVNLIWKK